VDRFAYILRRLVQAIPVLFGVTLLVFFMIHLVPGDPARTMLGVHATPQRVAALHREWGLDRSIPEQYWLYLKRLLHGNLGTSLFYRVSTASLIRGRLPVTLWLIAYGTLLSIVIALPLATLAATRKDKAADQAVRAVPLVGLGFPPFWLGIMLLLAFGLHLGRLFPVGGYGTGFRPNSGVDAAGNPFAPETSKSYEAGLRYTSPVTDDIQMKEIDSGILDLDLGAACDLPGGSRLLFGLTEDVIARSGPDFTMFATWILGL
jgi:ABC-type dipeptide/oligopeptide/nickel transport system permease component